MLHHHIFEPVGAFMLKERYSSEKESIRLHDVTHLSLGKGGICVWISEVTEWGAFHWLFPIREAIRMRRRC